jgi:UDP-glucose 4-epimerase
MTTVAVTGASGNVGLAVLEALSSQAEVDGVVAIARRRPAPSSSAALGPPSEAPPVPVEWRSLDVADGGEALVQAFTGAEVLIHLAWLIQPSRDEATTWRANVEGTAQVLGAAAEAGVGAVIVASSVGAYSPGPKDQPVAESWPTNGVATSSYSRQKSYVERLLDAFECRHPEVRVVRLRPGLVFQAPAATEIRRYFLGPFLPGSAFKPGRLPLFPHIPGVAAQFVHAEDLARAYVQAALSDVHGAFNVATDPPLDTAGMAAALGARQINVPFQVARSAAAASWHLRLQPTAAGWLDLARDVPLMDITRAHSELGWAATRSAPEVLRELFSGMAKGAGAATAPLAPDRPGRRLRELASGIGGR